MKRLDRKIKKKIDTGGPYKRRRSLQVRRAKAAEIRRSKPLVSDNTTSQSAESVASDGISACTPFFVAETKSSNVDPSAATAPTASFLFFSKLKSTQLQDQTKKINGNTTGKVEINASEDQTFVGRRVVSCSSLDDCMNKVSDHCHPGMRFRRSREANFGGLHREIYYKCCCGYELFFTSDDSSETLPVNVALSEACLVAPIGYEATKTLLTTLDLPSPSVNFFLKCQNESREKIEKFVGKMLLDAGKEERRLAEEAGDFIVIDGKKYVWITIILDGGWPKRSYSHTYDSPCGVAVIIGARTGKILYFGTRTKTCVVCTTAANKGCQPKDHLCFKNWTNTSTAMEQDILLEGFRQSISVHGIVYRRFVGDGDSSVHSAVIDVYPGIKVEKISCYNHVTKNLNKKLIQIATDSLPGKHAPKIPKEERQLPGMEECFKRLGAGVNGAIVHHSEFCEEEGRKQQLYEDIANSPLHIFGDHSHCRAYFCDPDGDRRSEPNRVPEMKKMTFWEPMMKAVMFVANLSPGLIYKCNTNRAESFMSIANMYVEGKRKHLGGSYLYGLRMSCAALGFNLSRFWLVDLHQDVFGLQPSTAWLKLKQRGIDRRLHVQKSHKPKNKKIAKFGFLKTKRGDQFYGDDPTTPEFTMEQLNLGIMELRRKLQLDDEQRQLVEEKTREQADSAHWHEERRPRITASVAGKLYKLRPTSDNTSTLNYLLGGGIRVAATEYGKQSEARAVAAHELKRGYNAGHVQQVGLLVSRQDGIYGASADGLVGEDGLLEVKSPYSLRDKKPEDWPKLSKASSPLRVEDGKLILKRNHDHFYQVVMQMHVCERDWADYFVWTPNGSFVERIVRDDATCVIWDKMKIKFEEFWKHDLAPEIVDSQKRRGKPYRCLDGRLVGRNRSLALKEKRKVKN